MAIDILKSIWPEWEIGKRLGGGSYGVVYEARRSVHGVESYAAIKVISIPASESELDSLLSEGMDAEASRRYLQGVVDDFVKEIQVMESLQGSANIVNVTDYQVAEKTGELGWYIFIRMELLTPFSVFVCDKKFSEADVIKLGCDICTALDICEKQNIIHRDIKPGNIMVHKTGNFKLGDFGIARSLENATVGMSKKYSPNYVAPEVISSSRYDGRVDIYSLGLVLYRLMNSDRLPFLEEKQLHSPGELKRAIDRRICGEALPAPCEASPELAEVILRACAFDPDDRFSSAAEMKEALQSVKNGSYKPISIQSSPAAEPLVGAPAEVGGCAAPEESRRKKRAWWIPVCVLIAAVLIGVGVMVVPRFLSEGITQTTIIVQSKPTKTLYYVGEELKTAGLTLTALYSDGSFQTINSGFTCSPMILDEPGTQLITVSYGGKTASFTVTVQEKTLLESEIVITKIEVESMPEKTSYYEGDTLDASGLTVNVTYSDGSTRIIESGFVCSPTTLNHAGEQTITVSYEGETTAFDITVDEMTPPTSDTPASEDESSPPQNGVGLTEIAVKSKPTKTTYYEGDTLDISGLTLTATYSDGSTKTIESGFICNPMSLNTSGEQTVMVSFAGKSVKFTVTVQEKFVTNITLDSLPTKRDYYEGNTLDSYGLKLTATYNDGSSKIINSGYTCYPTMLNTVGEQTITVNYGDQSVSFTVTVQEKKVTAIALSRKIFSMGESVDPSTINLTVNYNDGTSKTIKDGFICSPSVLETAGTQQLKISYDSFEATVDIEVFDFYEYTAEVQNPSGEGYNEDGRVYWELELRASYNGNWMRPSVSHNMDCSWGIDDGWPVSWEIAKKGTAVGTSYWRSEKPIFGQYYFGARILLPDDPSFAGEYVIMFEFDGLVRVATFTLKYEGNYDTGTGWSLENIEWTDEPVDSENMHKIYLRS